MNKEKADKKKSESLDVPETKEESGEDDEDGDFELIDFPPPSDK